MSVYIIILYYKNPEDTMACLQSIAKLEKKNINLQTIIVNNDLQCHPRPDRGSRDWIPPDLIGAGMTNVFIENELQRIIFINNSKNLGFAAGMNVGIKEALKDKSCGYILILNNDTVLPPDLFTELIKQNSDITSPVIKFKHKNNWTYDFGGKINWSIGRTYHIEHKTYNIKQKGEIDYMSGCCMLVKRRVFESIGLFDEKFFFYFEDVDFCVRAAKSGFKISISPNTSVYHKLGGSIGRWSNTAIYYNLLGNFIFITKHLGFRRPIGYLYLFFLTIKIVMNKLFT